MADVCGRELVVPQHLETSSLGAAFLAMYAVGEVQDLRDVRQYVPDMQKHELYARLFEIYEQVYHGVAGQFPEICEIQAASIE